MGTGEQGIATTMEYVLLFGVSLLIFSAVFMGFASFINTASSDSTSEAAYRIAMHISECISDASRSGAEVVKSVDIPERICGKPYLVYPSGNGICVLVNGIEYEAPVIAPAGVKMDGFMVSMPADHRIDFEPLSKTATLA